MFQHYIQSQWTEEACLCLHFPSATARFRPVSLLFSRAVVFHICIDWQPLDSENKGLVRHTTHIPDEYISNIIEEV